MSASIAAYCLDRLESLQGQGVNKEVIRNVAGMVYFGEPRFLEYS